jgi:excinuclease ABC subunit B
MSKFQLRADFQPLGDQPTAIAQLTEGLKRDVKEQTLLGVTGSGKSVVGSSKVLIEYAGKIYHLPISQLGGIFRSDLPNTDEVTQLAEFASNVRTVAFNPITGSVDCADVAELSRHRYNGQLYEVETMCGRSNQFTDSHNVYVLRDGDLQLVSSSDLQAGDWLPIPDKISLNTQGVDHIDTREWLPEDSFCYVSISQPEAIPSGVLEYQKSWRVQHQGERVRLADYRMFGELYTGAPHDRVGSNKQAATVPVLIPTSSALWRFLGLYIAEGHATRGFIVLSTSDSSIATEFSDGGDCFGLTAAKRTKTYDYQISGQVIASLLRAWCGATSKTKHLPMFWPQCNKVQLGQLLSGIFAGDGWVEAGRVCLASVSRELVHDVQTALLSFGIHARIRPKTVIYLGAPRSSWVLRISGREDLKRFQGCVGFGLARKDNHLSQELKAGKEPNTNVDIFPFPTSYIHQLSQRYGLYQRHLAEVMGVNRSCVSMYMAGLRKPSRIKARRLFDFLLKQASRHNDLAEAQKLQQMTSLTRLFWSPISEIKRRDTYQEPVYDLTVPSCQTFFAGGGGYFVHNTFTMANLIQNVQRPTLVLSHNKTLAAQLYGEFKKFFPDNAVHYFVSYFDYYQPEAYIARSDTYIEKDSQINEEIERMRHAATDSLLTRRDVIIVASVSCIYGIGTPSDYASMAVSVKRGERRVRDKFLRQLTDIQYRRNDVAFERGVFRVRGDVVDVFPAGEEVAYRIDFFGDDIERITRVDPLTGEVLAKLDEYRIFPSSHYVTPQDKLKLALVEIERELEQRLHFFKQNGQLLEAQRLAQRTHFDLEMMQETGTVKGIENYSRYLANREPGEQPATLLDYFPDDYMLLVDESHMSIPQVRGMYNGDRARKEVLVEHGFRLPSALDNRPLTFTEFEKHVNQVIYVSATPAEYELSRSPKPAQQLIRPTGLLDPHIEVRPIEGQIDDLISEIRATIDKRQRVLVTTLTKRMSEDLTEYLKEINIKVTYLHSDVDTLDRTDILRDLRLGTYDVLVGINLLREGLDLPEVSLVAILDADKEGFLRSEQALIQTVGRAARHVEGRVLMYADRITGSMQRTIDETTRRHKIQKAYNEEHGITPTGIARSIEKGMRPDLPEEAKRAKLNLNKIPKDEYGHLIKDLTAQMELASANLEFEKAAELRDIIADIKQKL